MIKNLLIVFIVFVGLALGFYALNNHIYNEKQGDAPSVSTEPPTFSWRFENADTVNGDGNPNTNVFLDAKYDDGEGIGQISQLIQVSHGSCNELPDADADTLAGTTNVQCYGAGLGFTFKIIKGDKSYLVMKKEFDEGSPDYNPPAQEYKVIAEFSF